MSENNEKYVPQKGDIVAVPMKVTCVGGKLVHLSAGVKQQGIILSHPRWMSFSTDYGPPALISRPKPPAYFDGVKVGDAVYDLLIGEGVITALTGCSVSNPISVTFANGVDWKAFTKDGKWGEEDAIQTLFYATDPRVAQLKAILEQK